MDFSCGTILLTLFLYSIVQCDKDEPVFKSVPTTVKTYDGDTVLLPCYVHNIGSNTVRWWRGKKLLVDSANSDFIPPPRVTLFENNTLQVAKLQPSDTGEYICQVVRPAPWGPLQQVHAIEVLFPPSVTGTPENGELIVKLNDEVDISCNASGVPQPIITWTRQDEELKLLDNRPRLRFQADDKNLSGNYTCVALNGVGEPAKFTINVRILFPPKVTAERTRVHAAPGVRAELVCHVEGDPEPVVEWLYNSKPISRSSRVVDFYNDQKYTLLFRNVRVSDLGFYACQASNDLGHNQQMIELSGVANVAEFKRESHVSSNNNFTLIWEVDSYSPIIEYNLMFRRHQPKGKQGTWTRLIIPGDVQVTGPLHTKEYTLNGLSTATVYEAMVLSRNRFGWSLPSAVIRFATDGPEGNSLNLAQPKTEENFFPVDAAAIFNNPNSGSRMAMSYTGFIMLCSLITKII